MCKSTIEHNDFNAGFFKASLKAYQDRGNFVASPLSVLVLMSALLAAKGPKGDTATEICSALVGKKKKYLCKDDPNYGEVVRMLREIQNGVNMASQGPNKVLTISDGAFAAKHLPINEKFAESFTFFSKDKVMRTLFNTTEAFNSINDWANKSTDGLIPKYLKSPDELSSDTLLVLLNAIAFKDNWARTFDKERTMEENFRLSKHETVKVPMMNIEGEMTYIKEDDYYVLSKPFKSEQFSFVIFLPEDDFEIDDIEDDLEDGDFRWEKLEDPNNLRQIHLTLPKFKIERSLDLKPALELLGIRKLFTRGQADLSGISDQPLFVSDAKQVSMLEVDESGVKAAAVSGMNIMPMSIPPPAIPFRVDQPFYCAIYDTYLKMPLFIARVVDPR